MYMTHNSDLDSEFHYRNKYFAGYSSESGQKCLLTLLHSEQPKLLRVLAILSAVVLNHYIAVSFSAFPLKLKNLLSENHKIYMYMYLHENFTVMQLNALCRI